MSDDLEQLPDLQEVQRRLRDLHFNEYHRDNPRRHELHYENVDGVIERGRAAWERVRAEIDSRKLAGDLGRSTPAARLLEAPQMTPLEPALEAERKKSLRAWAIQRFKELSRQKDLHRIQRIGLTIEGWVRVLEREE